MPSGLRIRSAVADDADDLFRFVAGLTDAYFPGQAPWTSSAQLRADGFGAGALFEAFMAELDGEAVGLAQPVVSGMSRTCPAATGTCLAHGTAWSGGCRWSRATTTIAGRRLWIAPRLWRNSQRVALTFHFCLARQEARDGHRHCLRSAAPVCVSPTDHTAGRSSVCLSYVFSGSRVELLVVCALLILGLDSKASLYASLGRPPSSTGRRQPATQHSVGD